MPCHIRRDDFNIIYISAEDGRFIKSKNGNFITEYSDISIGSVTDEDVTIPNLENYKMTIGRNLQ